MKALSVRQPWAWLIVEGHKNIENRDWPTKHRGNLLIHAAKGMTLKEYQEAVAFVKSFDPTIAAQIPAPDKLKLGGIVGMVEVVSCVTKHPSPWFVGRFGFVLAKPYPLPFRPMRGMLGLFNVNEQGEPEEAK